MRARPYYGLGGQHGCGAADGAPRGDEEPLASLQPQGAAEELPEEERPQDDDRIDEDGLGAELGERLQRQAAAVEDDARAQQLLACDAEGAVPALRQPRAQRVGQQHPQHNPQHHGTEVQLLRPAALG